jgi:hypothetical protein
LAHDRLIEDWEGLPLQGWLSEDRIDRRLIESLKTRFSEHQQGGPLLHEKALLDAKDFLNRDLSLKNDEPQLALFIEASVAAELNRQRRRQLLLRAAIAAAFVFLVVAALAVRSLLEAQKQTRLAQEQRDQAFRNESQFRAEQAWKQLAEGFPVSAMQLALTGLPDTPETLGARPWVDDVASALVTCLAFCGPGES